jgi:hypothetical protein
MPVGHLGGSRGETPAACPLQSDIRGLKLTDNREHAGLEDRDLRDFLKRTH